MVSGRGSGIRRDKERYECNGRGVIKKTEKFKESMSHVKEREGVRCSDSVG